MRYPASEKLEIIRIVEQSHLPAKRTLDQLDIPRRTFCRWYDRYLDGGPEALADRPSAPGRVWNRIPAEVHDQIIEMALEQSELSPRELAARFTDEKRYFVSEATVYRLLKAHDLRCGRPTSPTSRSSAGAGCICRPCSTITRSSHHRLEAVQHDAGRGCHRHAGPGTGGLRLRPGPCSTQTPPAQR